MERGRDRWIATSAVVVVAALSGLVVRTVLDVQARGREALRRNQETTIQQLAASMEQRISSVFTSVGGLSAGPWALQSGDPNDQARLDTLQSYNPEARSGMMIVDLDGRITSGTLLTESSPIGSTLERPGLLDAVRSGEGAILPAAPGVTTELPTIAISLPILSEDGAPRGAFVFESVIAVDSDFNKEIAALQQGTTGAYTFIDEFGTVIVSTDATKLAQPISDELRVGPTGLVREGGLVVARADVPSANWRLIFTQDIEEFEAGLGRRVATALLLLFVGMLVGGALAFVAVLRRLRAEREERARMQEINETREEFISIVSHELRTPVAGIAGFLDSTLDHWQLMDDDAKRHAVTRARANARRLQALTRDVLDSSAAETGEFSYAFDVVDIAAEVEAAVEAAREQHPERTITFHGPMTAAWARADPDRIQQVLLNLTDNALKNSPRDKPVVIDCSIDEGNVVVAVRDHGPGISEAERDKLFEKWVRGRTSVQGTGLGLYVSRKIIEAHHGELRAEDAPGGGEIFTFTVPLSVTTDTVEV